MAAKTKVQIGDTFNMLTVINIVSEQSDNNRSKRRYLVCSCKCGGTIKRETSDVTRGKVRSCGCSRRTRNGLSRSPEYRMWGAAKRRAKEKTLPFDIEISDIHIPTRCPLLGIELQRSKRAASDNSPSLDRLIPDLGYVKCNILVISHRANQIKNAATVDELTLIADKLNCIINLGYMS